MVGAWIKNTPTVLAELAEVEFPFEYLPQVYAPDRTIFKLDDGSHVYPYLWCYLERRTVTGFTEWNPLSLSPTRMAALPRVLECLSKRCRFEGTRAASINNCFGHLSRFLLWADRAEHKGGFECLLTDAALALEALKGYHTYLRHLLQTRQLKHSRAAIRDQQTINILSQIHDRNYKDEIEPLSDPKTGGTECPQDREVAEFMSLLQAIFDSAARLILRDDSEAGSSTQHRVICISATDDSRTVTLPEDYSVPRLMELACVVFSGLAIGDSGANLAQIRAYEEPENLQEQLAKPDRINLTQKVIKLRAGGKIVPISFTAVILSRISAYLKVRELLIAHLGGKDIASMFVQCRYSPINGCTAREPVSVCALSDKFLTYLRSKLKSIGVQLPLITLRQLRTYKQQHLARKHGVRVAADMMGHSVATAVAAYCKAQESTRQSEIGQFLKSLTSTVFVSAKRRLHVDSTVGIAVGSCAEHGKPKAIGDQPMVRPDCNKTEGCFFCVQYRVHADETDLRKLLSCRHVLQKIAPLQGESATADRVYTAVIDCIDALLTEIGLRIPEVYRQIEHDVQVEGNLSCYWAAKLQQLHLLGMLASAD